MEKKTAFEMENASLP